MKKKICKVILLVIYIFVCIISVTFGYLYACFADSRSVIYSTSEDIYKVEEFKNESYEYFQKVYYNNSDMKNIFKNNSYKNINDNSENVKENVQAAIKRLEIENNKIAIDFNYDLITPDDYYYESISSDDIYFRYYDTETKVLYVAKYKQDGSDIE